jgi:chemotaxis protein MotB
LKPPPVNQTTASTPAPKLRLETVQLRLARAGGGDRLFDGGDSLIDDDAMRSNWAVPWSDLMMTMFVLFAALLAAQTLQHGGQKDKHAQAVHEQPVPQPVAQELPVPQPIEQPVTQEKTVAEELPVPVPAPEPVPEPAASANATAEGAPPSSQVNVLAQSQDAVRESDLQNTEVTVLEDQSVKINVQGPMFFARGKAELRPEVKKFLGRLARVIRQTPYDIHVVGHADDRAINTSLFPSNWELSLARASHVARYLIDAGGVDPARFTVTGRGEYQPVVAGEDPNSQALNRRVEIIITRNISKSQGASTP